MSACFTVSFWICFFCLLLLDVTPAYATAGVRLWAKPTADLSPFSLSPFLSAQRMCCSAFFRAFSFSFTLIITHRRRRDSVFSAFDITQNALPFNTSTMRTVPLCITWFSNASLWMHDIDDPECTQHIHRHFYMKPQSIVTSSFSPSIVEFLVLMILP